jgi:hypothetical protein
MYTKVCFSLLFLFITTLSQGQNTRLFNHNTIGWYNYFGTIKINSKFGLHTEYQFRRNNLITDWQQSLLRVGLNYQLHSRVQLRLGYAWIETFPYGDIPLNSMGKDFTEHRLFQMVTITDKINLLDLSHRFMLEQRWVGRYSEASLSSEDEFPFMNRLRYMFRIQVPLKGKEILNHTPYLVFYDEIFAGFGQNVNENIFDQNRVALLFGYRLNQSVRIEGGYLNQILQLGREVNNQNVFQNNNGIIVSAVVQFL